MILCCGEALIDMLPRETTRRRTGLRSLCRRRGLQHGDRARAARRAGRILFRPVVGSVRQPVQGRAGGEQGRLAPMRTSPTGRRRSPSCKLNNGHATYTFYDENTAGRMLTVADLPELGDEIEAMLFGAISLISEPAGSAYEELMRREHGRRVMMLDPNIRPNFIPDKAKAPAAHPRDDGDGRHRETVGRRPELVRRGRLARGSRARLARTWSEADRRDARQRRRHRLHQRPHRHRRCRKRSRWSTRSAPATPSTPASSPRCTSRAC